MAGVGANETAGRVEVNYLGSWGTICDDDWGMEDARVVCRQLNLGEPVAFTKKAHFGQGTGIRIMIFNSSLNSIMDQVRNPSRMGATE